MSRFANETVKAIKPSGIRRFFDIASEMDNVISLGVGEPDFATPYHIRQEAELALQNGYTFYTANAGLIELREEIAKRIAKKTNINYNPKDEILVTIGGSEAIDLALRATVEAGDEVIYTEPAYVSYLPCIQLAGGTPVPISLKEEDQFRLTPDLLQAAITDKSKILILSFPNNPTGAIMEKEDLEAIRDIIIENDLLVITDEIYDELIYNDKGHFSIISLAGMKERTVYINGFSKSYSMTGWRIGYCCGPADLLSQMTKIHQFTILAAPTTSQLAAIQALREGDMDIAHMRKSYNQRRRFLLHEFEKMGLDCFEPHGAFYVFPNISQFGLSSEEFATQLLQEERVAVVPGSAFGKSGEGYVRISYAYSIKELQTAVNLINKFIQKRK